MQNIFPVLVSLPVLGPAVMDLLQLIIYLFWVGFGPEMKGLRGTFLRVISQKAMLEYSAFCSPVGMICVSKALCVWQVALMLICHHKSFTPSLVRRV